MVNKTLKDMQRDAAEIGEIYRETFDIDADPMWYFGKLTEEVGELNNAFLRATGQTRQQATPEGMADEAADVLGFLLVLCAWQGIDLEDAFNRKWGKYLEPNDEPVSNP